MLKSKIKWYVLILSGLTNAVVVAAPSMALSVLLPEISKDLNLSLVQAGIIWGIGSLPLIVVGLLVGALGDRFGPKRVLTLSCLLVAVSGALRGLSADFPTLALTSFIFGCLVPLITINNMKSAGSWFSSRELGLATGVISMGMAFGFFAGSLVSATFLSPWLGGWRNVFYFYGAISLVFSIPWMLSRSAPAVRPVSGEKLVSTPLWQGVMELAKLKKIWLLSFATLGISGSIQGLLGYLPLYLRGLGWPAVSADGAMAAFHVVSMTGVLPITLLSDRTGTRKKVVIVAALLTALGIGLLSIPGTASVWIAVVLAGLVRDASIALLLTMVIETHGVGSAYSGLGIGFVMIFMGIGNLAAPPLGNSLAAFSAGAPFLFWAGLAVFGLFCITMIREVKPALNQQSVSEALGKEEIAA